MSDYKLVPVEPTPEMMAAGKYALEADCYASGIYADMLAAAPAVQGDLMLHGFRVMHLVGRPGVREGERWEIYAPCGSGGVVHEDDVTDWVVRKLLDALAAPQPAEQQPAACVGCEGAPGSDNSPCAVCGQQPAPDVAGLVEALEEIENPIKAMRDRLQDGEHLDGFAAVQLAGDAEYLRSIARAALAPHRKGGNP